MDRTQDVIADPPKRYNIKWNEADKYYDDTRWWDLKNNLISLGKVTHNN